LITDANLWNIAAARIKGFVINIPQWPHQAHVDEYHQIVAAFQKSCSSDFSDFKIPESAMSLKQHQPPSFLDQTIEGLRYCDSVIFRTKVFGLINYAVSIVKEDQPPASSFPNKPATPKELVSSIYIGTMQGSQIVQHSSNTSIKSSYDPKGADFRNLVNQIKEAIPQLKLDQDKTNQLHADIGTVEVQVGSPTPKTSIIAESMHSIRTILETVATKAITSGLLVAINHYFPK
jgi:hypothetical protein